MITLKQREEIKRGLDEIECNGHDMTKWELDFIASLTEQFKDTGSMSPRQKEILDRIWEEKT